MPRARSLVLFGLFRREYSMRGRSGLIPRPTRRKETQKNKGHSCHALLASHRPPTLTTLKKKATRIQSNHAHSPPHPRFHYKKATRPYQPQPPPFPHSPLVQINPCSYCLQSSLLLPACTTKRLLKLLPFLPLPLTTTTTTTTA